MLDDKATLQLVTLHRGRRAEPLFVLMLPEGSLRRSGPHLTSKWSEALAICLAEPLIIYNCRSKKACRVVWKCAMEDRTVKNCQIEAVRLVPHSETLRKNPLRSDARLFHIEGGFEDH